MKSHRVNSSIDAVICEKSVLIVQNNIAQLNYYLCRIYGNTEDLWYYPLKEFLGRFSTARLVRVHYTACSYLTDYGVAEINVLVFGMNSKRIGAVSVCHWDASRTTTLQGVRRRRRKNIRFPDGTSNARTCHGQWRRRTGGQFRRFPENYKTL